MTNIRTIACVVASTIALGVMVSGPAHAADPSGTWWTADRKGKVKIANCGGAICGTLSWLAEPNDPETNKPKTDKNNKDASKQGRPLIGVPIVLSMKPAGGDKWEGQVYNAEDGKTYSGNLTLQDANTIKLEGCILGGLVCKSQTWKRSS